MACLPGPKETKKTARFGSILPHFPTDDHRKNEITNLINAFWKILEDVGALEMGWQKLAKASWVNK